MTGDSLMHVFPISIFINVVAPTMAMSGLLRRPAYSTVNFVQMAKDTP